MKTVFKKSYAIFMVTVCLLFIFSSCKEDVSSSLSYIVYADTVSPADDASKAIAQAIVDYQKKAGILETPFEESIDKENLTGEDRDELDKRAGEAVLVRLGNCNFAKIIKDAGITVSDGQGAVSIGYRIGYPAVDGAPVWCDGTLVLRIAPDKLK